MKFKEIVKHYIIFNIGACGTATTVAYFDARHLDSTSYRRKRIFLEHTMPSLFMPFGNIVYYHYYKEIKDYLYAERLKDRYGGDWEKSNSKIEKKL